MRTEIQKTQKWANTLFDFDKSKVFDFLQTQIRTNNGWVIPVAFFLGRASLQNGFLPVGFALYAAVLGSTINRALIAVLVIIGMISAGAMEPLYVTIAAMFLFNAFNIPFKSTYTKLNFRHAILAMISVLIPKFVMVCLQGFLIYDVLNSLLVSFVAFALVFIFKNAIGFVDIAKNKISGSNEQIISVAITFAFALSGLLKISLLGVGIKNVLCILLVLLFSYQYGLGTGAAVGVVTGLVISLSSTMPPLIIASYAMCGLLSGVFKNLGRVGSGLGFILGNALLTLYMNGSTEVMIHLKEIVFSVAVFMVIPNRAIESFTAVFDRRAEKCTDKYSYSARIKEIVVEKLILFSGTFREISKTFHEGSQTRTTADREDITGLLDRVAEKVCKDCSLCLHCWDRNFCNTYQVMFKIIEKLEEKGRVEEKDIPAYFLERCERIYDFVEAVNSMYEMFKSDLVWKGKLVESRSMVSQQLEGLSKVLSNLASEISTEVCFKRDLEDRILSSLTHAGIKVSDVIVIENKYSLYEISIFFRGAAGKRNSSHIIEKIASIETGRKMIKEQGDYYKKGDYNGVIRLMEEEVFDISTGVAKVSKHQERVSGDCYTFMKVGNGKYMVSLSDGMGSGQKAAEQSNITINMLEQLMSSGFDKNSAIKLINSMLALKSSDDSYATIDLSVIDLFDGEVEFIKIGAVPTFIKRGDQVDVIKTISLPAGILDHVDVEMVHKQIKNGDIIIMMSDGVYEAFRNHGEGEHGLKKFIHSIESVNPQEIADILLQNAKSYYEGKPLDDMTVMASKVWKRVG